MTPPPQPSARRPRHHWTPQPPSATGIKIIERGGVIRTGLQREAGQLAGADHDFIDAACTSRGKATPQQVAGVTLATATDDAGALSYVATRTSSARSPPAAKLPRPLHGLHAPAGCPDLPTSPFPTTTNQTGDLP